VSDFLGAFGGVSVFGTSLDLHTIEPIRRHKRKRHQTAAYHKRIQKKWNKRYGTAKVPYIVFLDPKAAGLPSLGGPRLIAPPRLLGILRGLMP